jgi:DnaJ-class molecular chaperone
MKEYYSILNIARVATPEDIKEAFRRLSLQHHPEKNPNRKQEAERLFTDICEAYEVLGNPKWRAIYDRLGEDGLKNGAGEQYSFSGNANAIFQKFFGVDNPWSTQLDLKPHQFFSQEGQRDKNPPQCQSIKVDLACTLEEFFFGTLKKVTVPITDSDESGTVVTSSEKEIEVRVEFGAPLDTVIKFPKSGSTRRGWVQGDVYVRLVEIAHDRFSRAGNDMCHTVEITLTQALVGFPVQVTTLDGRSVQVFINEIVHPTYQKRVTGFGFPTLGTEGNGDLVLSFTTRFPTYLDQDRQAKVKEALEGTYAEDAK